MDKQATLRELRKIPSVGKACALDLWNIGIRKVGDLKDRDPEALYEKLNGWSGVRHDVCMLYTFRCAVYFASERTHQREKLNWWYWKDRSYP
jgi:hypothetical protein